MKKSATNARDKKVENTHKLIRVKVRKSLGICCIQLIFSRQCVFMEFSSQPSKVKMSYSLYILGFVRKLCITFRVFHSN